MNIKRILVKTFLIPTIVCGLLAIGSVFVQPPMITFTNPYVEPPMAKVLMGIHGCWQGKAPADMIGKIPGHVVVHMDNGTDVYSDTLVSDAMEHIFNHKDIPFEIVAFCR